MNGTLKAIQVSAFETATKLMEIEFPESLLYIGYGAFAQCGLIQVVFPERVESIEAQSFAFNLNIWHVEFLGSPYVATTAFTYTFLKPQDVWFNVLAEVRNLQTYFAIAAFPDTDPTKIVETKICEKNIPCTCSAGFGDTLNEPFRYNCVPCDKGTTSSDPLSQNACVECAKGKYSDTLAAPVCKACEKGKYSRVEGAKTDSLCVYCDEGTYNQVAGSDECKVCPPGNYCNGNGDRTTGTIDYMSCKPGTYQDETGQTKCNLCPRGKYSDKNMAASCEYSLPGRYCPNEGMTMSLACAAGRYSGTQASNCTVCAPGRYQDEEEAGGGRTYPGSEYLLHRR